MTTTELLIDQLQGTRAWTLKLVADIEGDEWMFQPATGLQHALWICGHLACAQELLLFQRCLDTTVLDPEFLAHFPIGADVRSEGAWPTPDDVRRQMDEMQHNTIETVRGLDESFLAEPAYGHNGAKHPHYDTKGGALLHMNRHEAFHAGQLATIRRLLGKSFLR